jgi:DNA-directed RNA polymerase subunit RPC12/RpoP
MEFLKKESLIAELREIFEEGGAVVKCPISKNEYKIDELRGFELKKLKTANLKRFVTKLIELVISKVKSEDDKEKIMNDNSYLDYFVLLKGLLESSFETGTVDKVTCSTCGAELKDIEVKYSDFKNTKKEWDKDVSFKDWSIPYEIELNGKKHKKIILRIYLGIPTIKDFYTFVYSQLKDIDENALTNTLSPLISVIDDNIKFFTKKIEVEFIGENGAPEDTLTFTHPSDFDEIISTIPVKIKEKIENKIVSELEDYVPVFVNKEVKCPECNEQIELIIEPQTELLKRIFKL